MTGTISMKALWLVKGLVVAAIFSTTPVHAWEYKDLSGNGEKGAIRNLDPLHDRTFLKAPEPGFIAIWSCDITGKEPRPLFHIGSAYISNKLPDFTHVSTIDNPVHLKLTFADGQKTLNFRAECSDQIAYAGAYPSCAVPMTADLRSMIEGNKPVAVSVNDVPLVELNMKDDGAKAPLKKAYAYCSSLRQDARP